MLRGSRRSIALAAAVGLAGACTVNPVTGRTELDLMGEAQEIQLGRALFPRYTQASLGEVPDPDLERYVGEVGGTLAGVSHRPGLPYAFNAVNDPEVNAYALPGGKISVTRGLLARLGSEDELAAVLGHETGHVAARHAARQYTRAVLIQLLLAGAAAYMEAKDVRHRELYLVGGLLGAQLVLARYSRDQERQADELGLAYAVEAGYSPHGMVRVMEVLLSTRERRPNLIERMFASHPMTEERLATARAREAAAPPEARQRRLRRQAFLERTWRVRQQRAAYDRLAEARRLLAEEKAREALPLLRQSADEWPEDGVLRAFLAAAEADGGDRAAALDDAARAARTAPRVFSQVRQFGA